MSVARFDSISSPGQTCSLCLSKTDEVFGHQWSPDPSKEPHGACLDCFRQMAITIFHNNETHSQLHHDIREYVCCPFCRDPIVLSEEARSKALGGSASCSRIVTRIALPVLAGGSLLVAGFASDSEDPAATDPAAARMKAAGLALLAIPLAYLGSMNRPWDAPILAIPGDSPEEVAEILTLFRPDNAGSS